MILTPLQTLPKNVGDLGKIIVAKGFKKSPKVKKIAQSGHTGQHWPLLSFILGLFDTHTHHHNFYNKYALKMSIQYRYSTGI